MHDHMNLLAEAVAQEKIDHHSHAQKMMKSSHKEYAAAQKMREVWVWLYITEVI